MKKTIIFFILTALAGTALHAQQHTPDSDGVSDYELVPGDEINFSCGPKSLAEEFAGMQSRGSFDMTSFKLVYDKTGNVTISEIRGAKGDHQSELIFTLCSGTFTRSDDTLIASTNTIFRKLFLIGINNKVLLDSFTAPITIKLTSRTLKNGRCPNLITTRTFVHVVALPEFIDPEVIYHKTHKPNEIGHFAFFEIVDSNGRMVNLPAGDYVLTGANSLSIAQKGK